MKKNLISMLVLLFVVPLALKSQVKPEDIRTLIVFFDGLRPDYITPENMPNVYAFKKRGVYGTRHHSVFPTVTRVNATSYATGSYPRTHGLMGNSVYFPEVSKNKSLNTGDATVLDEIVKATDNHLLTAVSLGELMKQNGSNMMVFSSGTTGQAMMQNHTISGGAIIHPTMIRPESMREKVFTEIGQVPPGLGKHTWITDAMIRYALRMDGPKVSAIWYGDPDGNAHRDGIGAESAMAAIKAVDHEFGRILADLEKKGLDKNFNILISSDHGFVTHVGKTGVEQFLIEKGLKAAAGSDDVVLAGGAIYVRDHDQAEISKIVQALQAEAWVGGIFTAAGKPGDTQGSVAGTLSFDAIHWNHPERAADILVDANWDDRKNEKGYAGTSYAQGVAGHGGFSPYEVHIPLIAGGPSFKKSTEVDLPTSNVDLVPTVLFVQGMPVPETMDGRVMYEILQGKAPSSAPKRFKTEIVETEAQIPGGAYRLVLERSILGGYVYLDYVKVSR